MYVVARSSASVVGSLPSSLGLISLSEATRLNKNTGFTPLAKLLRRGGLLVLLLGLCFAPLFQLLIPLVYGDEFNSAIPLAIYLVFGVMTLGLSDIIEQSMRGHGVPMVVIFPKGVGLVVLVLFGTTCVSKYGVAAMAIGFTVSQLIVLVLLIKEILSCFTNSSIKQLIPRLDDFKYILNKII